MLEPEKKFEDKPENKYIKVFGSRLKKLVDGIETMKNFGIDEDILISWLRIKTGLPLSDVKLMLKSQEEFYDRLLNKGRLDLL